MSNAVNGSDFNIIQGLQSIVGMEQVEKIGRMLGVSPQTISSAITTLAPFLVSGISKFGLSGGGSQVLMGLIDRFNLAHVTPQQSLDRAIDAERTQSDSGRIGQTILNTIFGNRSDDVIDSVAAHSGTSAFNFKRIATLLAPVIMTFVGNRLKSDGRGSAGLTDFLGRQQHLAQEAMPKGLLSVLSPAGGELRRFPEQARRDEGNKWWIVAAVAACFIGAGLWLYIKRPENPRQTASETVRNIENTADRVLSEGNRKIRSVLASMRPGDEVQTISFQEITFDVGTANLEPNAEKVVEDFAVALREHPAAVVRLIGHTDNTGDAEFNRQLSLERASRVRERIVASGIAFDRVEIEGHGGDKPVASNDSDEGRAMNRRVDVMIFRDADAAVAH